LTLTLTDSALRKRPRRHPGLPATEAESPEERCKSRHVAEPTAAARPKAVVDMSRAAQPRPKPFRKISCSYTQMGIHRGRPASVHVNQQVHFDLLPIDSRRPARGGFFCRIAERSESSVAAFRSRPRRHGCAAEIRGSRVHRRLDRPVHEKASGNLSPGRTPSPVTGAAQQETGWNMPRIIYHQGRLTAAVLGGVVLSECRRSWAMAALAQQRNRRLRQIVVGC
jgi:hypothetical protein